VSFISIVVVFVLPKKNSGRSAVNGQGAVSVHRDAISAFHRASGGRVDYIHALFCAIAEHNGKPPMPPNIMAAMLDLTPVSVWRIYHRCDRNKF
jgi:hypothetical protein